MLKIILGKFTLVIKYTLDHNDNVVVSTLIITEAKGNDEKLVDMIDLHKLNESIIDHVENIDVRVDNVNKVIYNKAPKKILRKYGLIK